MKVYEGKEWDGRTPFIEWMLSAYPGSESFLKCPSGGEYIVLGRPTTPIPDDRTILAYEPKSNHLGEGGFVAFEDGSVGFVGVPEYDGLIDRLNSAGQESKP